MVRHSLRHGAPRRALARRNIEGPFEAGPNPFDHSPYAGRVRHVAVLVKGDTLYVFFSAIGDAPERILLSTIALNGDWKTWKASPPVEVLTPREKYECPNLPVIPSRAGESEGPENALRDPALFRENGKLSPVLLGVRRAGNRRRRRHISHQMITVPAFRKG